MPQSRNPDVLDNVYVIDPDESVHDALRTLLGSSGYGVTCYSDAESFIESCALECSTGGFLLVEANLSGIGSIALIQFARNSNPGFPTIVLTSTSDRDIAAQAMRAGAIAVLEKPLLRGQLLPQLRRLSRLVGRVDRLT
jgi:FixJ family two-component response regulator